jgi:hypothetical protein
MFEPQVHPDVFPIPGGPPTPPYDNAGWTLALQMGVQFDRILDGFTGPFENVTDWNVKPPPGRITTSANATGFLTSRAVNNAFIAVNRLLSTNQEVYTLTAPLTANGRTYPAGTLYVPASGTSRRLLDSLAVNLGVNFAGITVPRPADATPLRRVRLGLWDTYGGSIDSGWARWILEQFEFPYERVFAPALDAGSLNARFDVLVFVGGAIPGSGGGRRGGGGGQPTAIPDEYRAQLGSVTTERTIPQIRSFLEQGGTVIAIGSSAENLASHLQLPIENHLVEGGQPLPQSKYYTPGSLLEARFDLSLPVTHGMTEHTHVFFDDSPVFRLRSGASTAGVRRIAWFDSATPLRSGWSWGQQYLENGVIAVEAQVGKGRALLFAPEILKRAQPHGTFKLLFNGILQGGRPN